MIDSGWERAAVPLKFQMGDIVLGKAMLSLFRRSAQLDERPLHVGDIPRPPPVLDGADGYVVWSQPIARKLPVLSARRDAILYTPRQYRRFSIRLCGDFEQYMGTFSARTRSGLRRKLRKMAEASGGTIDCREYRTPAQISLFFPPARKVSSKTYQERLLKLGLPADEEFFKSAQACSTDDGVRAYLLFVNGVPISYLYCVVRGQVVSYDYHGYDPAYAKLSPGTVLQTIALKSLFAEQRFTMFDFREGEGEHKERFSTESCLCGDVYVVSRRVAPMSRVMLHYLMDRTSASGGVILDRLKLKSRLRRLVRGGLGATLLIQVEAFGVGDLPVWG
jgi:GNAT acetyltransferase-like protein